MSVTLRQKPSDFDFHSRAARMESQYPLQTPDPTSVSAQARAYNDEEKRRRQRQAVQPLRADRVTNEPRDEPCDSHCDRDRCSGV